MNKIELRHDYEVSATEHAIKLLSSEIMRLIKLPYTSWRNQEAIRSLDQQIEYLESLIAAYEKDRKKL